MVWRKILADIISDLIAALTTNLAKLTMIYLVLLAVGSFTYFVTLVFLLPVFMAAVRVLVDEAVADPEGGIFFHLIVAS